MSLPAGCVLSASGLVAGYSDEPVLRGLDVELQAGQMLAIVGPNGAGKSTLLRVLSGVIRPRAGAVKILSRPIESYDRRALARAVAIVAQENPSTFQFTVIEVVLMGRAPHLGRMHFESHRDLEIAESAMRHFDLLALAHRPIQELSGGERKRVFLARALAQEPRIALLDEPTAFLDLKHIADILGRFRTLCRERAMAVIATLHDLNAAASYADQVLLMKSGAAVACGPPEQVMTEKHLREVYETSVYVGRNPATGAIVILPGSPSSG